MTQQKKILVIATGGTIESFYGKEGDGGKDAPHNVPLKPPSIIPDVIEVQGLADRCDVYDACVHDSKGVHSPMLEHIAHYIAEHDHEYDGIVITHGTDTMPVHARKLESLLAGYEISPKTVIFTGAMIPLRDKNKFWRTATDGWNNLKNAVCDAQRKDPGIYICMGGFSVDAHTVDKTVELNDAPEKPANTVKHAEFVARTQQSSGIFHGD